MRLSCLLVLLTAMLTGGLLSSRADAATLSLVGSSTRVCQLIGETIGIPEHLARRRRPGHCRISVSSPSIWAFPSIAAQGPLYFLFGDANPIRRPIPRQHHPARRRAGLDTTRTTAPTPPTCLDLQLATPCRRLRRRSSLHPTVTPPIQQGSFNVPTGGIYLDKTLYAFFWTNHCFLPDTLAPNPTAPLTCRQSRRRRIARRLCSTTASAGACWRRPGRPIRSRSRKLRRGNRCSTCHRCRAGFVYVTAAEPPPVVKGPVTAEGPTFRCSACRAICASIPYLALAPRATFARVDTWLFFAGMTGGNPNWITYWKWKAAHNGRGQWMPPAGTDAQIFAGEPAERTMRRRAFGDVEQAPCGAWLLLYNCAPGRDRSAHRARAVGAMVGAYHAAQRRAGPGPQLHAHPAHRPDGLSELGRWADAPIQAHCHGPVLFMRRS